MSVTITYALAAFPNARVKAKKLGQEIAAKPELAGRVLDGVSSSRASCFITLDDALTGDEQTALDAVVAAHQGNDSYVEVYTTHALVLDAKAIVAGWNPYGYARSNVKFFDIGVAQLKIRVLGEGSTVNAGTQLRLIETVGGVDVDLTGTGGSTFGGTGGAWAQFQFDSNVTLRDGEATYRLEARLNGAAAANIRGVCMATYDTLNL